MLLLCRVYGWDCGLDASWVGGQHLSHPLKILEPGSYRDSGTLRFLELAKLLPRLKRQ